MEILFLRHGESEGNAAARMQGRRDYPLTALGREQAAQAGTFLHRSGLSFAAAYVSPLARAFETAEIVARAGVEPKAQIEADLAEISVGALESLNEAEIRERHPPFLDRSVSESGDFSDYGGESYLDVQARVARLRERLEGLHRRGGDRVLLIGHGGFHYQFVKSLVCDPIPRVCILKMGNCTATLIRLRERRGQYLGEIVFHVPVELMGGVSGEGAARLFR